jgi:hypothetical protein
MNHLIITTASGPLYLVGQIHTNKLHPVLLAMGGVWTPDNFLHELVDDFPGASVVVAPFPGMGGSLTGTFDIPTISRMVDEAIGTLFHGRAVVTYGVSTGCLVTLGLRSPEIFRHVAAEPFFRTTPLWPLKKTMRDFLLAAPDKAGGALAAKALFGYTPPPAESQVDRDYRYVRDEISTPVDVILGDQRLEPDREMKGWPSFTSAEDRASLAANPLVTLHHGPPGSGHWVDESPAGKALVKRTLGQALLAAAAFQRGRQTA